MNSFGTSSQKFPLYDPQEVRDNRRRFRRPEIPLLSRVNSIYVPTGEFPVRGWILLARSDYDKLNKYSTSLELEVGNPTRNDNVGVLKNLAIVQAQCVTRGIASDENALYLVEITDGRGIVCNKWFHFPVIDQYNIRTPAYPSSFFPGSMNDGTTWTWSTMIGNLWNLMSTFLGSYPGLPSTALVSGTPEGFWFPGTSAWKALCNILEYLGLTIACDLTQDNPYTIVRQGIADSAFTALQTKYVTHLEDNLEWIDTGAGRVPGIVKVLFRRRNKFYGTEETVRYEEDYQWSTKAVYSVSVNAPSQFTGAVGTHYLWSDFTVRYDHDSNPLAEDVAIANTIASERVTQYYNHIYGEFVTQTYAGALPFTTGSEVEGVCWYQNYENNYRGAWRTQIVHGIDPPWPEIYDDYK